MMRGAVLTKSLSFITLVYLITAFYGQISAFAQNNPEQSDESKSVEIVSDPSLESVENGVEAESVDLNKDQPPLGELLEQPVESRPNGASLEEIFGTQTLEIEAENVEPSSDLEEIFGGGVQEQVVEMFEAENIDEAQVDVVTLPENDEAQEPSTEGDKDAEVDTPKVVVVEDVTEDFIIEGGSEEEEQVDFVGEIDDEAIEIITDEDIDEEFNDIQESLGFVSVVDLVKEALKQSPEIGIVSEREVQSESDIRRAEAGFYPKVDLRMDGGMAYHDPFVKPDATLGVKGGSGDEYNSTATVTQLLFDGFSTNEEIKRQEQLFRSTQLQSQDVYQNIMLQVIDEYMDVTYLDSARKSNQLLLDVLQDIESKVRLQTELGGSALASLQYVQSRISQAKVNKEGLDKRYRNILRALALQTNISNLETAKFDFPEVPKKVPSSLDKAVDAALKTNVNMSIIQSDIKALEHAYEVNFGRSLPTINSVLKANQSIDVGGDVGTQDILSAKIELSLSLYDGGVRSANASKIRSQVLELQHRVSLLERNINEQLFTLYNELNAIELEYAALSEEYDATIKLRDIYLDQVALQHNDVIQLVEAQERAHQTYMRLAEKIRDKARVYFEILRVTGDLYLYFCGEEGCKRMAG